MKRSSYNRRGFGFFLKFLLIDFKLMVEEFFVQFWCVKIYVWFEFESINIGNIVKRDFFLIEFKTSFSELSKWFEAFSLHLTNFSPILCGAGLWLFNMFTFWSFLLRSKGMACGFLCVCLFPNLKSRASLLRCFLNFLKCLLRPKETVVRRFVFICYLLNKQFFVYEKFWLWLLTWS